MVVFWQVVGVTSAGASGNPGVGLDATGQVAIALLIAFLTVLTIVAMVAHSFKKHPMLELIIRISACAAILLMIILVTAGVIVDMAVKDKMTPELAFILVLLTIVLGIIGVVFASLYKSSWVEGPLR